MDRVPLIEACVDSVDTAVAAVVAGATRIELCGPGDGGTTPSPEIVAECRDAVSVPLHVMIRPRPGNFVYDDDELAAMIDAIAVARACRCDGVVFGPLVRSKRIADTETATLVAAARGMHTVFHRAFDQTPDPLRALDLLVELGVGSVLTSGGARTALEGADMLAALVERSAGRVVIMAGGGVRAANVRTIVERSNVTQVHARGLEADIIAGIATALRH